VCLRSCGGAAEAALLLRQRVASTLSATLRVEYLVGGVTEDVGGSGEAVDMLSQLPTRDGGKRRRVHRFERPAESSGELGGPPDAIGAHIVVYFMNGSKAGAGSTGGRFDGRIGQ
jgi:hypothetical protein